ncbi:MAG: lysophospholipid acyltransferase family protein [Planctomycetes bacterium]|nr:lysophospholipid acyltransferase family protein [Planctomycetota bacterium]
MAELETSERRSLKSAGRRRSASSKRWRHLRRSIGLRLVGWLGPFALRRLRASWKSERLQPQHWDAVGGGKQGVLLALWHGRMVCGMADHAQREFTVLVSQSRDGDISEKLLRRFGYKVIRGSSSRGGASAARAMLGALEQGAVLVITPDGPRGPRHAMNPGLAWMARETGFPVLPMGFACDKAWRLDSWDRFTIPKYGARVVLSYGEPVRVGKDADEAELARATSTIAERLIAAEERGFAQLAQERDW